MVIRKGFSFITNRIIFNPFIPGSLLVALPFFTGVYMSWEQQQQVYATHQKMEQAIYAVASPDDDTLSRDEYVYMLAGLNYDGMIDLQDGVTLTHNLYGVLLISGENRAIINKDNVCKYLRKHSASLPQNLKGLEYCLESRL